MRPNARVNRRQAAKRVDVLLNSVEASASTTGLAKEIAGIQKANRE